ncbi:MAG: N-formylglutamate amidohydrolase [Burkholderiaceae bacterium]|nr:N-formylglutamate amidohydrolase [Burkholderiaceae bacterium]
MRAFTLIHAEGAPAPLVLDSPHSGSEFPPDFGHCVTERELRDAEDFLIDELFGAAPRHGATLIAATVARTYVDVNRSEADVDPELLEDTWPRPIAASGKARIGKALVWRTLDDGRPIYARRLAVAEVQQRIDRVLRPYHAALRKAIDAAHERDGVSFHINCHSMKPVAGKMSTDGQGSRRADIVLGDRDGTTCSGEFTELLRALFADAGYDVRVNDPYKGVELVRAFSDPRNGRHSLQIELNRALYMRAGEFEKNEHFERLSAEIDGILAEVARFARANTNPDHRQIPT